MTEQEILDEWLKDAPIDKTQIDYETLNSGKLHHKYLNEIRLTKSRLFKAKEDYAELKKIKFEYYHGNLDDETIRERGYAPQTKKILKEHIPMYMDADQELRKGRERIFVQENKLDILKDIMNRIAFRNMDVKNYQENRKFENGGG